MASMPTSIRLSPSEKRQIAAAARKRGLTPTAFIKNAALAQSSSPEADFEKLRREVDGIQQKLENEMDYQQAAAAWERHINSGKPARRPEEVWRELGV